MFPIWKFLKFKQTCKCYSRESNTWVTQESIKYQTPVYDIAWNGGWQDIEIKVIENLRTFSGIVETSEKLFCAIYFYYNKYILHIRSNV